MAWIAAVGLCVPIQTAPGGEPCSPPSRIAASAENDAAVGDLDLSPGGLLAGQVLDANARPAAGTKVVIRSAGQSVAITRTDANGTFAVTGLRGGLHQIATSQGTENFRLWSPGTAPPNAERLVRITPGQVVRGQFGGGHGIMREPFPHAKAIATNPLVIGGLIAAAVAIPIALNNADEPPGS
jgi:hypothetical protein